MKAILAIIFFCFTNNINAIEKRTYTQHNSSEAIVAIETGNEKNIQASSYVDALENELFIHHLLIDQNSKLFQLKARIEKENCDHITTNENPSTNGCGKVTITKEIRISFGRGGWETAGASYVFFVGFTNKGSGRYFDVSRMVTISETAEAQTNQNGTYKGTVVKTLRLGPIKRIDEDVPLQKY
jgi:hypothetical protein